MHDCRSQGGHFFAYMPQSHAFRCYRCQESFASSYSDHKSKHPWKCQLERCGYIACDPCSDILMEELALFHHNPPSEDEVSDEVSLRSLSMKSVKTLPEDEKPVGPGPKKAGRLRRGAVDSGVVGGFRDLIVRDIPKKLAAWGGGGTKEKSQDLPGAGKIEVDDDNIEEPYSIPVFTRTARQAVAQAVLRRAHVKLRPVTRHSGETSDT